VVAPVRVLAGLLLSGLASAHPLHTTYTEVTEDTGTGVVTVVVRSFTDDLARAMADSPPVAGSPAHSPGDSALARYIRSHLSLTDRSGRVRALVYVGQRQSADLSWVTFRTGIPAGLAGCRIADQLQTELYADQVNLLQAHYAGRSETILFSVADTSKILP
jgi:hypothetical protein